MSSKQPPETMVWPSAEALIAGTTALMTAWADPSRCADVPTSEQRMLVARKIVENLLILQQHPGLHENMRRVMGNARERWQRLVDAANIGSSISKATSKIPLHIPAPTVWH